MGTAWLHTFFTGTCSLCGCLRAEAVLGNSSRSGAQSQSDDQIIMFHHEDETNKQHRKSVTDYERKHLIPNTNL